MRYMRYNPVEKAHEVKGLDFQLVRALAHPERASAIAEHEGGEDVMKAIVGSGVADRKSHGV